jgi:hypothetical protein
MGRRKLLVNVLCVAEAFLAVLALVAPMYIFPACESPMHCHFSFMGETGMASVVIACAAVTAVAGAFMILYPSVITGVCQSPMMPCHYGLLPTWNLIGGAVILLSVAVFIAAREERG